MNLRIPGPTPCPPEVLESCSRQMINHRGPEFSEIMGRVTENLKHFFQTENDVLVLTTSGTGIMEAMVVSMLSPGQKVLGVTIGSFGNRFVSIAEAYGANVTKLEFEWGTAADPAKVAEALRADPGISAMLVTHNETSTGVTNPLADIAKAARAVRPDVLIIVDAVSSLSSIELKADAWGLDVVGTGSQKGWMVPPGLAFASVNARGWAANATAKMPRFYHALERAKDFAAKGQTPWTPAVSILYGLDTSLQMMRKEGMENIFARHQRCGDIARDGVKSLGLKPFADPKFASNTVTAVHLPEGIDWSALNKMLRTEYDTVLSGGQGKLQGKIFRIGHLGYVSEVEVKAVIDALKQALPRAGYQVPATA